MSSWVGIGVMSGSSLDGVDLCCAEFTGDYNTDIWSHRILKTTTIPYDHVWWQRLNNVGGLSGRELVKLHVEYGRYLGQMVSAFIDENHLTPKYVACHGHTIFHQPESGFTFQLGDGETMAASLRVPLVTNFRSKDVALGGQGAPLVPVGESYLFSQYTMCLNLGGIANISVNDIGFDISPCNMLLNYLAFNHDKSIEFDKGGDIARRGHVIDELLCQLNNLPFYRHPPPKSLGKEWFEENIEPLLKCYDSSTDLLRTAVEHITDQIINVISQRLTCVNGGDATKHSLLITGGGALNDFLMERLRTKMADANIDMIITESDEETIQFKEALIFAFLGLRCLLGLPNISLTVTGATTDSTSGSIHLPPVNCPLAGNHCQDYRFHFRAASLPGFVPPLRRHAKGSQDSIKT